ncbi:DNA replication/repair protein RecF [Thorsellia kenyensis]|uniref:DNA replication and repair protein RecF n=1 Tax=Thorsellia kenyensis TaxID=1549888 RepID=A0ABV6C9N6_9GAMM
MLIERLMINQFRNIIDADIRLNPGINAFVGDNGSGKTSLLEAIYTLGHGRAFRTSMTQRVIHHDAQAFYLHASLFDNRSNSVKIGLSKDRQGETKVKINEVTACKIADLAKNLPIQLITPEGFSLIDGGPKFRRAFIDWGVFHHTPNFFEAWFNIKRLIKQRNAALKQHHRYKDIQIWDEELVKYTYTIHYMRQSYCDTLIFIIKEYLEKFLPGYVIDFNYYPGWNVQYEYDGLLSESFERDKQLGYTSFGAHKADLKLTINKLPVESVLSRGQLKLLMCAMRLAQGDFFARNNEKNCLFLLDDFSSELDTKRQTLLAESLLEQSAQVCITALRLDLINMFNVQKDFSVFSVKNGCFYSH